MIVTFTPNPSLDRTVEVPTLVRGEVLRATRAFEEPGGKGVNVARFLAAHGSPATAVLPVGGIDGPRLVGQLTGPELTVVTVPVTGATRSNTSLVEPDGTTTKVNEPGAPLLADELEQLLATLAGLAASWVAGCGSLPPGAPDDLYARVARRCTAPVVIDTSGSALRASLAGRPALIKPNREELAELTGMPVATLGDAVLAAGRARVMGAGAVLATLGADGALLVEADGMWHASAPVGTVRSTVGAGDATLAGFLHAGGHGPDGLRAAVAWGAAATEQPGTGVPTALDRPVTLLRSPDLDLDRHLTGATA